jgi:DNA-directed RNA polymerase subunit RPC12/RpoP
MLAASVLLVVVSFRLVKWLKARPQCEKCGAKKLMVEEEVINSEINETGRKSFLHETHYVCRNCGHQFNKHKTTWTVPTDKELPPELKRVDRKSIRKQIYELTLEDLERFPIWEFCLDEECEEGQDECTLRPFRIGECNFESMFICAATFTLANGAQYHGFVSPENDLGYSQPTLYIDNERLVYFWYGPKPTAEAIDKSLEWLGGRESNIFPIIWRTPFLSESIPQEGKIDGIYYLYGKSPIKTA